ncbi:MAG: hypothetical protein ACOYLQ_06865 [Hyphomicrobiaceae bacterium]
MSDPLDPLVLDLVEWIARSPRTQGEVLEVWRTSCPRLTVWEDAVDRGYVARGATRDTAVRITPAGAAFLVAHGRAGPTPMVG